MTDPFAAEPRAWTYGASLFAGIMLVILGMFQGIRGMAALFKNDILVGTPNYVFAFDTTAWGWIHMIFGLILIVTGLLIVAGKLVGRIFGIIVAGISAILNFTSLPYYPVWSVVLIAIDVLIIWALATDSTKPLQSEPTP